MDEETPSVAPTDHAVILAAGRGSRLQPEEGHKLLVEIEGIPLLDRHLRHFERLGVCDVTVVTGYRHESLDRAVESWKAPGEVELHTAINPAFDGGNGLSVLAGIDQARRDGGASSPVPFWLTMSDHLFGRRVIDALEGWITTGASDLEGLLAVDRSLDAVHDLEDATGVRLEAGEFRAIGKELEEFGAVDCGLFWCGEGFVEALDDERRERGDCTTSDAVRRLAESDRFGFVDIGEGRWQDIDTPEAREHAEQLVASGELLDVRA